jgi:hypothetical protein
MKFLKKRRQKAGYSTISEPVKDLDPARMSAIKSQKVSINSKSSPFTSINNRKSISSSEDTTSTFNLTPSPSESSHKLNTSRRDSLSSSSDNKENRLPQTPAANTVVDASRSSKSSPDFSIHPQLAVFNSRPGNFDSSAPELGAITKESLLLSSSDGGSKNTSSNTNSPSTSTKKEEFPFNVAASFNFLNISSPKSKEETSHKDWNKSSSLHSQSPEAKEDANNTTMNTLTSTKVPQTPSGVNTDAPTEHAKPPTSPAIKRKGKKNRPLPIGKAGRSTKIPDDQSCGSDLDKTFDPDIVTVSSEITDPSFGTPIGRRKNGYDWKKWAQIRNHFNGSCRQNANTPGSILELMVDSLCAPNSEQISKRKSKQ